MIDDDYLWHGLGGNSAKRAVAAVLYKDEDKTMTCKFHRNRDDACHARATHVAVGTSVYDGGDPAPYRIEVCALHAQRLRGRERTTVLPVKS